MSSNFSFAACASSSASPSHHETKRFDAPLTPQKEYVFFDFDGTLANTPPGILETATRVLSDWGLNEEERGDVSRLIGPPFPQAFELIYGFSPEDAAEIAARYRKIYWKLGPEYYPLYDGVKDMLSAIKAAGIKIALTTSKQEELAIAMSKTLGIDSFYDVVSGNVAGHGEKGELIRLSIERFDLDPINEEDTRKVCMVGDRSYDIVGAQTNAIDSIGVLYGAGSKQELMDAGATRLAKTPEDITHIILGNG